MKTTVAFFKTNFLQIILIAAAGLVFLLPAQQSYTAAETAFMVTNKEDSGAGSLRQAILDANAAFTDGSLFSNIHFSIPDDGIPFKAITLITPLPEIKGPVKIDGYTQPSASPNTLSSGTDAKLLIQLDGGTMIASGLQISAGNSTVKGLSFIRFPGNAISLKTKGGNRIAGNFIGVRTLGDSAAGNGVGISVESGDGNVIGGTNPADRNQISGNEAGTGIQIGTGAVDTLVQGNLIGTTADGKTALANQDGIVISGGATGTVIGGTAMEKSNIISGNKDAGIQIKGVGTSSNLIQRNGIGIDVTGGAMLGNGTGVKISDGATNNMVGGTSIGDSVTANIISGNGTGVEISGNSTSGNKIQGNLIGTKANGTEALGNGMGVSVIDNADHNTIGGAAAGQGNTISGNNGGGVRINATLFGVGNVIQGNFIGTQSDGVGPLGNMGDGIRLGSNIPQKDVTIGGTAAGAGNTIAFNGGNGIAIAAADNNSTGNAILSNRIFSNGMLGIDLNEDGVTVNDRGDADLGPNNRQNFPELASATSAAGNTVIQGKLESTKDTKFRIEFFSNPSCNDLGTSQGETLLGAAEVTTDGSAVAAVSATLPVASSGFLTATATNQSTNDTSEFSMCQAIIRHDSVQFNAATYTVNENGGTATITVTRSGSNDLEVKVDFTTGDANEAAGIRYTTTSTTLTFAQTDTEKTVAIPIKDNSSPDGGQEVTLTLFGQTGGAVLGNPSTAVLTIVDDETCGNRAPNAGEECDDGNTANDDACLNTCKKSTCGDGFTQVGVEECDDGNKVDTDACLTTCKKAACGDGSTQAGLEECDDANSSNLDACSNTCKNAKCGDGFVQGAEPCDDGNVTNGDGCSATCQNEVAPKCGDGIPQAGEECDDGNTLDTDACLTTCKKATCGDGFTQAGTEECDDANSSNLDTCTKACKNATCGDGFVQGAEACDDGGVVDGNGCSATCQNEAGVVPKCGDGIPQTGEECDDGNATDKDGCDSKCLVESATPGAPAGTPAPVAPSPAKTGGGCALIPE